MYQSIALILVLEAVLIGRQHASEVMVFVWESDWQLSNFLKRRIPNNL